MTTATKTQPQAIVAYAKVLRLTDRLLIVAEELRDARQQLDVATLTESTEWRREAAK